MKGEGEIGLEAGATSLVSRFTSHLLLTLCDGENND